MTSQAYSPGLDGVIAAETAVSFLDTDAEQILVRGYDLIDLARHLRFPDVAFLVIYGHLPSQAEADDFCAALQAQSEVPDDVYEMLRLLPKNTVPMDALRTGISFLAGYEDAQFLTNTSHEANLEKGIRLLAKLPAIAINAYRILHDQDVIKPDPDIGYSENFLYMLNGKHPDEEAAELFDKIHMLYIEHEMPNSTFAARVICSTLSDIYGGVTGAVASLKGPLHGGANEAAIEFMLDILDKGGPSIAESYVMDKLAARARIMGFGHRVYMKKYDPRALLLRDYVPQMADRHPKGPELAAIYETVEKVMFREKGLYPNTDYPIGLLYHLIDVPVRLYTPLFLCARAPGLVAHVLEQHDDNKLFRPRVIYTGERGLKSPDKPISKC
jgi:citrate synthase